MGLSILCRQWGFFFFGPIGSFALILVLKDKKKLFFYFKKIVFIFSIALLVGGWFYLYLFSTYKSVKAFNRPPAASFSFANQPREFYFSLGLNKLFKDPVRKAFPNMLIPKFYSEFWGDHECYFLIYGKDSRSNNYISGIRLQRALSEKPLPGWFMSNRYQMGRHLGRVNLLSVILSIFFLSAFFAANYDFLKVLIKRESKNKELIGSFFYLIILTALAGYFWFLIMYPSLEKGDTIKATYLLHIFPIVAILSAELLEQIRAKSSKIFRVSLAIMVSVTLHNFPFFLSRY